MAAIGGFETVIKLSGSSTAMVNEPTTALGGDVFQITSTSRQCLDPSVAVTASDTVGPVTITNVDYLWGKVTLASAPTGAVTVSASYLPLAALSYGHALAVNLTRETADVTPFDPTIETRQRVTLFKDLDGSFQFFDDMLSDLDPLAPTTRFWDLVDEARAVVLEVSLGQGPKLRAWVVFGSNNVIVPSEGVVDSTLNFALAPRDPVTVGVAGRSWEY